MAIKQLFNTCKSSVWTSSSFTKNNPSISIIMATALKILGGALGVSCPILYISNLPIIYIVSLASISAFCFINSLFIDYNLIQNMILNAKNAINSVLKEVDELKQQVEVNSNKGLLPIVSSWVNDNPLENGYQIGNFLGKYYITYFSRAKGFFIGFYDGLTK
ncbi:MAG: hypothetical protein K1060chlam5_00964 [Candidatus Anoxychlamydiales bacterium]|nr:hypothetical protein [Candidatus Anoxychlamydiales bacterium]